MTLVVRTGAYVRVLALELSSILDFVVLQKQTVETPRA